MYIFLHLIKSDASIKYKYILVDGKYVFTDGSIISCTIYNNDAVIINRFLIWYYDRKNNIDTNVIEMRLLDDLSSIPDARTGVFVTYINSFNIDPY